MILLFVAAVVLLANLRAIVRTAVEKGGTLVLGVPAKLQGASVSIFEGTMGLDGLTVGSPQGFDAPEMFQMRRIHASVDLWSLLRDEIVIYKLEVEGPEVTLEIEDGRTNWGTLMSRLKKEAPEAEGPETKLLIRRIVVQRGSVRLQGLPVVNGVTIPLPNVEIEELRTADGKGVTARKVATAVVEGFYRAIGQAVEQARMGKLEDLGDEMASVLEKAGTALDKGALTDKAAEAGEGVKKLLKDVLSPDEEQEEQ